MTDDLTPTPPGGSELSFTKEWAEGIQDALDEVDTIKKREKILALGIAGLGLVSVLQGMVMTRVLKNLTEIGKFLQGMAAIPSEAVKQAEAARAAAEEAGKEVVHVEEPPPNGYDPGPQEVDPKTRELLEQDREYVQALVREPEVEP